jgi:hypothetical protein
MKPFAFLGAAAAAVLLSLAGPSAAGDSAGVRVTIGPELQSRVDEYGQRELDWLAQDLQRTVERQIARTGGVASNAQIELVITDARPNRPTMQQMTNTPGLSFQSFSIGGATIDGVLTTADGSTQTVHYRWYENDIRDAQTAWTWSDAHDVFDRVARRNAQGQNLASR